MPDQANFKITVTPYLCAKDATAALEFYKKAFGATETMRLADPSGRIGHAEIRIGDAVIFLADEFPDMGVVSPQTLGGSPVLICLDVPSADEFVSQAIAAGATELRPVKDQFYGRRSGQIQDPFGHKWEVGTEIEKVSLEEMKRRAEALFGGEKK